jgi:hypothetical protein
MSSGKGAGTGFATSRARDWPSVRQFNVFLENRVGALLNVVRRFETTDIRIVSLTVNDLADCAIIRIVLSDPERGLEIFQQARRTGIYSSNLQGAPGRGDQYRLRLHAACGELCPARVCPARGCTRNGGQYPHPAGIPDLHGE